MDDATVHIATISKAIQTHGQVIKCRIEIKWKSNEIVYLHSSACILKHV